MKLKEVTIAYIILGILSIFCVSIMMVSVSNFIYYLFLNSFDIEEYFFNNTLRSISKDEIRESFKLIVDYVILGREFKGLGSLKYNDLGLSHLDDVRKLCMMIESHMGKWNTNKYSKVELPVPTNELQRFVHRCDYLASRNYLNVRFLKLEII